MRSDEHSAAGSRDDLVAVERVEAHIAECAGGATVICRAKRLRGILDQQHAMQRAGVRNRRDVCALSVQMHEYDRARECVAPCRVVQCRHEQRRIHVPRRAVGVDEYGSRTHVAQRKDGSGEGECTHPHFIACPDSERFEREMQRRRARAQGDRMR